MRILIVDDEPDICEVASIFLQHHGECETAQSGADAIEKIKKHWAAGETVDCIFMDLMMPGMDGIETLKTIRQMEFPRVRKGIHESKIIMLTASNHPKHIMGAFKEQIDGYIVKPFDDKILTAEMKKVGLLSDTTDS